MKNFYKILIILLFISSDYAQNKTENISNMIYSSDSINIGSMVQAQIELAKEREAKGEIQSTFSSSIAKNSNIIPHSNLVANESKSFLSPKLLIISSFSLIAFLFVFIRRLIFTKGSKRKDRSSKNSFVINREMLTPIRKELKNLTNAMEVNSLDDKAKELNISKGELVLAARLKSLELTKLSFNNRK